MYLGIASWQAQNGVVGSGVAAAAGAKLADDSTPQHAGQAGNSKGGKNSMLNRPQLDVDELCPVVDPETGLHSKAFFVDRPQRASATGRTTAPLDHSGATDRTVVAISVANRMRLGLSYYSTRTCSDCVR